MTTVESHPSTPRAIWAPQLKNLCFLGHPNSAWCLSLDWIFGNIFNDSKVHGVWINHIIWSISSLLGVWSLKAAGSFFVVAMRYLISLALIHCIAAMDGAPWSNLRSMYPTSLPSTNFVECYVLARNLRFDIFKIWFLFRCDIKQTIYHRHFAFLWGMQLRWWCTKREGLSVARPCCKSLGSFMPSA